MNKLKLIKQCFFLCSVNFFVFFVFCPQASIFSGAFFFLAQKCNIFGCLSLVQNSEFSGVVNDIFLKTCLTRLCSFLLPFKYEILKREASLKHTQYEILLDEGVKFFVPLGRQSRSLFTSMKCYLKFRLFLFTCLLTRAKLDTRLVFSVEKIQLTPKRGTPDQV